MDSNGNVKLTGMVSGGTGGMGLGMLAAGLMGVNPLWGLLGGIPGAIGGSKLADWYAKQQQYQQHV